MLYLDLDEKTIVREIKKLKPIPHNRFFWWRRFDKKSKPLDNKSLLLHKIQNGDFDFSQYFWQAKFSELEINTKLQEYRGDIQILIEKNSVDLARRKRLWEDFEKEEFNLLTSLKKSFLNEFIITETEYDYESSNYDGTLEEFYLFISRKYPINKNPKGKRGRPKKI
jgi:hypothetical protein